jgi:hypothetical protein
MKTGKIGKGVGFRQPSGEIMRRVDLRDGLPKKKGSTTTETTMYTNHPYYGMAGSGKMPTGISFFKVTSMGVRKNKAGRVIWWHSSRGALAEAIALTRKMHGLAIPTEGWSKVRIKHYNTSLVEDIIKAYNESSNSI